MNRLELFLSLLLIFGTPLAALEVVVEQVLDVPTNRFGTFDASDSAVYAPNGKLLLAFHNAFNLFVLEDDQWIPLIDEYRTPEYNLHQQQDRSWGVVYLYNSKIPGEFLFYAQQRPLDREHYRVFVDQDDKIRAEWVSKEYYDTHDPRLGLGLGFGLRNGYRISLTVDEIGYQAYWPVILDRRDTVVYRFIDEFPEGFVPPSGTIATNPDRDRVSMVISYNALHDDIWTGRRIRRQDRFVIFRITYDE